MGFLSKFDTVKVITLSEGCQTESQNKRIQSAEHPNMLQPSQWNSQVRIHAVLQLSYNTSHTSIATLPWGATDKQFTALSQTTLFKGFRLIWLSAKIFYMASPGSLKRETFPHLNHKLSLLHLSFYNKITPLVNQRSDIWTGDLQSVWP